MADLRRRLEMASSAAILVLAVLMCVLLVKDYLTAPRKSVLDGMPTAQPRREARSAPGPATIEIPGMDFSLAPRTLVFVVAQHCRFCKDSEEFYRSLLGMGAEDVRFAAMVGSPQEAQYYQAAKLRFHQIALGDMEGIGVNGTPTLLLVDGKGKVLRNWVGRLSPEREKEVVEAIQPGL